MTSLMHGVRRTDARRGIAGIAGVTFVLALAGCNEDRASNADAKEPIAVTAAGVEIMEVVKREDTRTVEAVVVAGGEERQVTLAPFLDGPLPSGMRVALAPSGSNEATSLTFGWDARSGAASVRHELHGDVLEVERVVINGRVVEDYTFGGQTLRLEYSDLSPAVMDKAIAIYQRGEPLIGVSADVIEFVTQLQAFDGFAAQLPSSFLSGSDDARLLASLIGDETFGEDHLRKRIRHQQRGRDFLSQRGVVRRGVLPHEPDLHDMRSVRGGHAFVHGHGPVLLLGGVRLLLRLTHVDSALRPRRPRR